MNAEIKKQFFIAFPFVGKHLHTKLQKILSNGLDFSIFFIFGQFWLFTYQISVNFPKQFGFCKFSSFLSISALFSQKGQKRQKSKIRLCGEFPFTKRHLHTKFQKISSNGSKDNLTDARTHGPTGAWTDAQG